MERFWNTTNQYPLFHAEWKIWNRMRPRAPAQNPRTKGVNLVLDRQGTQHQRPESPTVTSAGMRVNTGYITSIEGASSLVSQEKIYTIFILFFLQNGEHSGQWSWLVHEGSRPLTSGANNTQKQNWLLNSHSFLYCDKFLQYGKDWGIAYVDRKKIIKLIYTG